MPVDKKKHPTASKNNAATTPIPEAEPLRPENFHQYLRTEIRQATRTVMEEIMREELSLLLEAEWGESTAKRNGFALLLISSGQLLLAEELFPFRSEFLCGSLLFICPLPGNLYTQFGLSRAAGATPSLRLTTIRYGIFSTRDYPNQRNGA